jgi:diguanylate cyclase (GGDEF)-like protein/PAS domain S-box-containing protein
MLAHSPVLLTHTSSLRAAALRAADIRYSDSEASFNLIARVAAGACRVPIGLVNFVDEDRQWTKASCGLPGLGDLPLDVAFCPQTILGTGILEIPDTALDPRYASNPLVVRDPFIRFYAGAPLFGNNGVALGALCVLDRKPNLLTEQQRRDLVELAALVSELVAMRVVVHEDLRSKVRVLSEALEHSGTPIFILEQFGDPNAPPTCTYANLAFERQFALPAHELIGRPITSLNGEHTDPKRLAELQDHTKRGSPVQVELEIYGGDGVEHLVEIHRRPVPSEDGRVTAWVVAVRDITAEHRAAAELAQQADRMRALYSIASKRGLTGYSQVDSVIELGLSCLGLDYGFVAQRSGDRIVMLNTVGEGRPHQPGELVQIQGTWLEDAMLANDVRSIDDLRSPAAGSPIGNAKRDWGAYIVAPISIGDDVFGAIGLAGYEARKTPFTDADREFVRLIGTFIGPSVERKLQKEKLDALAFYDDLTGLCNRAMLFEHLEAAVEKARRDESRLALHYIDLDGFKAVNDSAGHAAGDFVLQRVASRLQAKVRDGDIVARIGGDEFVVVQTMIDSPGAMEALAARLIGAISQPYVIEDRSFTIGASIGIAAHSVATQNVADLLSAADRALYHAKARAKGSAFMAGPEEPGTPA